MDIITQKLSYMCIVYCLLPRLYSLMTPTLEPLVTATDPRKLHLKTSQALMKLRTVARGHKNVLSEWGLELDRLVV